MSEELYRVEEYCTTGWEPVASGLNRTEAQQKVHSLMNEGYSTDRIRVVREK
jgi:hypothetical protein